MRKLGQTMLGILVGALLVASCASGSPQQTATNLSQVIEVKDDAGRDVKLARPGEKIVSLSPSNTELLYAVGAGDMVVGVDDYSDFPELAKGKEKVGGYAKTNIEKVVALGPDLVLATNIHVKAIVPELEGRGLTVVVIQPKNIEAVLDNVALVGKLTGKQREAEEVQKSLKGRLDAVAAKSARAQQKTRVYFELDGTLFTVGPGSFIDDMIIRAGGQNIADDAKTQWPQLNAESIIVKDPQVIILSDYGLADKPDQVKARPGWQAIAAVKTGRVVLVNADLMNRPGPRVFQGIEELVKTIHPELGD